MKHEFDRGKIMTSAEIKELAIQEWQWVVENWNYQKDILFNRNRLREENPNLVELELNSSFCNEYFENKCIGCPLRGDGYPDENVCCDEYYSWCNKIYNKEDGQKQAEAMLEKIKGLI